MIRCSGCGLASCDEVGTRSSDGVFDEVRDEEGEDEGDEPSEDGDVRFMCAGANDEGPCDQSAERYGACIDE